MKKTFTINKNHIFLNKDLIKFHNKPENSNYQEFIVNNKINENQIKKIQKKDKNYKEEKKLFSSLLKSKSSMNITNSEIKLKNELLNCNLFQTNYSNNNNIINNNEDLLIIFGNKNNVISQNTSFSNSKKQLLKKLIRPPIYKTILENKNKKEEKNEKKEKINNNLSNSKENLFPIKIANSIYSKLNNQKKNLFNNVKLKENFFKNNINISNRNKNKSLINFNKFFSNNNKNYVTNYLSLRSYNSLPITFPINLSYNNNYETFSEKNRQEKLIDKFIKLKTIIKKFPNEKNIIIKEFLLKNNIIDKKYYSIDKINNFLYFLNHPFNFDPKKNLMDIINEAVNYKPNSEELLDDQNQLKPINYFKNSDNNSINDENDNENNINNNYNTINNDNPKNLKKSYENIDLMKYSLKLKDNFTNINDNEKLIKDLENELEIIQKEKNEKLKFSFKKNLYYLSKNIHNNNLNNNNNNKTININNLKSNLCLSTINIKKKYFDKIKNNNNNKKSLSLKEKEKKINEINNRLYYNNIFKDINDNNNIIDNNTIDLDYIKRKLKLTEFIYLNRIKNKEKINNIKIKYNF